MASGRASDTGNKEVTITIVPSYEDGQRVTDDDSNDTDDPKGVS